MGAAQEENNATVAAKRVTRRNMGATDHGQLTTHLKLETCELGDQKGLTQVDVVRVADIINIEECF